MATFDDVRERGYGVELAVEGGGELADVYRVTGEGLSTHVLDDPDQIDAFLVERDNTEPAPELPSDGDEQGGSNDT
jgi:hypothetical protein